MAKTKVATEALDGGQYGYTLVVVGGPGDGSQVGSIHESEADDGTCTVHIGGATLSATTVEEVVQHLAAKGFELDDVSDVERVMSVATSCGVRVVRDPGEAARFRMQFVSGKRGGDVVEIDVRVDGTEVEEMPAGWLPMKRDVGDLGGAAPGHVTVPIDFLYSMLRYARIQGRHDPMSPPDPDKAQEYRDQVDDMLAELGIGWHSLYGEND